FQRAHGLEPDGVVGRDTRAKIEELRSQPMFDGRLQLRESGEEVRTMQVALNQLYRDREGWTVLEDDGKFGGLTQAAVERFQREHGLQPNGVADRETLARLQAETANAGERPVERAGDRETDTVAADAPSVTDRLAAAMRSGDAEEMARVV